MLIVEFLLLDFIGNHCKPFISAAFPNVRLLIGIRCRIAFPNVFSTFRT